MRNVSLYKTLKDYCIAVLAMVNEKIKVEELPYRTKEKFEITESNGFSQSYVTEIDWRWLVYKFEGDLKAMDAYKSAARALKEDEHVSKHLNNLVGTRQGGSWRIDCEWILLSLLRQLLSDLRGLEFQEAIFDKVYGDMEDYFYRDMIEVRFLAPLKSFKMQADKIEISSGFFIIRIPNVYEWGLPLTFDKFIIDSASQITGVGQRRHKTIYWWRLCPRFPPRGF